MPKQLLFLNDFSGGLNNRFRQNRIADNESAALRNARWTRLGALTKRFGTARNVVNVSGLSGLVSLFSYRLDTMTAEQMLISDGDQYVRTTSLGNYNNVVTGMTDTFSPEFLAFNGLIYINNGRDTVRTLDASNNASTDSNHPIARYHIVHKNRIFTWNQDSGSLPSRLQWSDAGVATWISTNFEDVYPNDGGGGTGIVSMGDELILFKGPSTINDVTANPSYINSKMFRVLGDVFNASSPQYIIEPISLPPSVGLLGHRTAKLFKGGLIFATSDGFYFYEGGGRQPYNISESIRGEVQNWELSDIQNQARKPAAVVWKNRYHCSLYNDGDSADGYCNRVYIYDEGKWFVDVLSEGADDFQAGSGSGVDWVIFNNTLFSAGANTNVLREWDTSLESSFTDTQDNGTAENVNFSYLTKELDFGKEVHITHCYIYLRRQSSGTLTFEFNNDQRGAVSTSVDMTAPDSGTTENASSNVLKKEVLVDRRCRTIQFRLFDRGANDCEIYAIEVIGE